MKKRATAAIYGIADTIAEKIRESLNGMDNKYFRFEPDGDTAFIVMCYGTHDPDSIEEHGVLALKLDSDGKLWVATTPDIFLADEICDEDLLREFAEMEEGSWDTAHWSYIEKNGDSVFYVDAMMRIADALEEETDFSCEVEVPDAE